jgi:beta-phosphoglucomutase-like phosphatase (HAD superfamily)
MKPEDRAQRVVALTAIKDKAEELAGSGMDALGVKTFVAGARRKLAEEKPDPETYYKAAIAAKARKKQSI